jgi:flagellar hook-associated protein 2
MAVSLSGLGSSGIDTDAVITQLIAIESQPLTRMTNQKTVATTRSQALTDIETRLKNLKTSSDGLKDILLWNPTQSVTSSDSQFSAVASAGVAPGAHSVKVTQLARASQDTYDWTPQTSDSSMTINGVTVNVPANSNVNDVASLVNGNAALGVYAVNAGGRLVLTSRATGVANTSAVPPEIDAAGSAVASAGLSGADAAKHKDAQNAIGELDGEAFDQRSNTIIGSGGTATPSAVNIPGLTITLKGVTDASNANIIDVGVPAVDRDKVSAALQDFVKNYNDTLDFINGKITEKKETSTDGAGNATTDTIDYSKGVLFGDSGLRDILSQMRMSVSNMVGTPGLPGTMNMLSQLGISTGAASSSINTDSVAGKLTFDADTFNAAMDADPTSAQKLLGGQLGSDGFAQSFSALLTPLVQSSGIFDQRIESANSDASDLDEQMATLNARLDDRTAALRKQFTAMETAISNNNSQLSSLLSALGTSSSSS